MACSENKQKAWPACFANRARRSTPRLPRCLQVQYDPNTTGPRDLIRLLADNGFTAHLEVARYMAIA